MRSRITDSNSQQDVDAATALKLDDPALKQRNARKLLECVNKLEINIMNPPRKGKKLLVLDLDYTILVSWKNKTRFLEFDSLTLHFFCSGQ